MDTQKHIPLEADIISQVMLMGKERCLELVLGGTSVKGWPTPRMFYRPWLQGLPLPTPYLDLPTMFFSSRFSISLPKAVFPHCFQLSSPFRKPYIHFPWPYASRLPSLLQETGPSPSTEIYNQNTLHFKAPQGPFSGFPPLASSLSLPVLCSR